MSPLPEPHQLDDETRDCGQSCQRGNPRSRLHRFGFMRFHKRCPSYFTVDGIRGGSVPAGPPHHFGDRPQVPWSTGPPTKASKSHTFAYEPGTLRNRLGTGCLPIWTPRVREPDYAEPCHAVACGGMRRQKAEAVDTRCLPKWTPKMFLDTGQDFTLANRSSLLGDSPGLAATWLGVPA